MFLERHRVALTTAADGSIIGYTPVVTGRVLGIRYVKTDFADGVDFTITAEATGETVWTQLDVNASVTCYPRAGVHDTAGVAATTDGTRLLRDAVHVANDRIKISIVAGGDTKSGTFHVLIG